MKKVLTLGLVCLASAIALQFAPIGGVASAATTTVNVNDNVYQPASVTVNVGDTVHWVWVGANPHTVTASDMSFDSGASKTTGTFDHTFSAAGTFTYFCQVHGQAMTGTVTVQQAAAPTATTGAASTATTAPGSTATTAPAATSTTGPGATATRAVSASPAAPTTIAIASTPTRPAGGAGAGQRLPNAGSGADMAGGFGGANVFSVALAVAGAIALGGAALMRRRRA